MQPSPVSQFGVEARRYAPQHERCLRETTPHVPHRGTSNRCKDHLILHPLRTLPLFTNLKNHLTDILTIDSVTVKVHTWTVTKPFDQTLTNFIKSKTIIIDTTVTVKRQTILNKVEHLRNRQFLIIRTERNSVNVANLFNQ